MGLGIGHITLLLEEDRRRPFSGSVVTLGRQTVFATADRLARLFAAFGKAWPQEAPVDDITLFRALGFSEVCSVDASDFEAPTHLLNLNEPATPAELCGRFDLVLDGGTLEHVFHLPNALAHMGRMVRDGGRLMHMAPSSNYMDHGFYMFSPTLFHDYYRANGAEVNVARVIRHRPDGGHWELFDYDPAEWSRIGVGGLDGWAYLLLFCATAPTSPLPAAVPEQGYYVDAWRDNKTLTASGGGRLVLDLAQRVPGALPLLRRLRGVVRRLRTGTAYGLRHAARISNR